MKKKILATVLISSLLVVGSGCSPENIENDKPKDNLSQPQEANGDTKPAVESVTKEGDNITYEILTLAHMEDDLQTALSHIQKHRGFGIMKEEDDSLILYIGLGEKPSAGYGLEIENIIKNDNRVKVIVKETKPAEDAMVAEVLTYPTKVIRLKDKIKNIEVINKSGEVFEDINAENEE